MKVLFFPQFYFMQYIPFSNTIRKLLEQGVDAKLIHIPNISELDESNEYNPNRYNRDSVPYINFSLWRPAKNVSGLLQLMLQLVQFKINSLRLLFFLKNQTPDVVVIGSHLGQMYIRQLQVFCAQLNISVVCLWHTFSTIDESRQIPPLISYLFGIQNVVNWEFANKYTNNHHFLVTGDSLRDHLINYGIKEDQIQVTGNPQYDDIYYQIHENRDDWKQLIQNVGGKYIVVLTEVIQDVFGLEYLKDLLGKLKEIFGELPKSIKIVIKFHPREPTEIKSLYRAIFLRKRYFFSELANTALLLRHAELSIGHFTAAAEVSLAVGTPFFSINIMGNNHPSFFSKEYQDLEFNSYNQLKEAIIRYIQMDNLRWNIKTLVHFWCEENIMPIDGKSSARVADVIVYTGEKNIPKNSSTAFK